MIGFFTPTCYFSHSENALCVILERKQLDSLRAAHNPDDQSESAEEGRKLLAEIEAQRKIYLERNGRCHVRLIQRWYDGAPV
jgi:hypothetical protein